MGEYKNLEELVGSSFTPKEREHFKELEDSKVLNLNSYLEKKNLLKFRNLTKLKSLINEIDLSWKDLIYPAVVAGGLALSYTYSNHFINFLKFISQESKHMSNYYEEFLENYELTFRPLMNFAGALSLIYSSTFNSFTSIKYLNKVKDKKEKVFIGSMLALSSLALGYSTYALFSNFFGRVGLNLFKEELRTSLFNMSVKTLSSSASLMERNYFLSTLNGLFKSFGLLLFSISPVLYPSLIPRFHDFYNRITGKKSLSASLLLLPSGEYSLNAYKTKLGDFLNHSLFFIEEKYIVNQNYSFSDVMKLIISPISKSAFYAFSRSYNLAGKEKRLKRISDNLFWKAFSVSGAFIKEDKESAVYVSSLISEGKRRIKKYVEEVNLSESDQKLLVRYLMPFYLSAVHTDAPSKLLHLHLKVEMSKFLNYALREGYLEPFKSRRNIELFHVKNPFGNSSFLEDIVVKLVDCEKRDEKERLEYEANSLSILNTRSLNLSWISKLKSLYDAPPLTPIPLLFNGSLNLGGKNYYALITWMLKGRTLLEEINPLNDEDKFALLSNTLHKIVEGTARLNYNALIEKRNLSKIRIFNFEDRIIQKIIVPLEKLSSELNDPSLLLSDFMQDTIHSLVGEFNKLYSYERYLLGDVDLNLENILLSDVNCGGRNCKPIIIDPVLEFGPVPNLFYTYLADQRKGIGERREVKLVEEYLDLMRKYELSKEDKFKLLTSTALLFAVRNLETEIMFIKYANSSEGKDKEFFLKSIHPFSQYLSLFDELPLEVNFNVKQLIHYAGVLEEKSLNLLS